jgi:predicted Zn-dependent protease
MNRVSSVSPRSRACVGCLAFLLAAGACATSPLGRSQLVLVSDAQMAEMGVAAFDQMKKEQPISSDARTNTYVRCVATAVTAALPPDAFQGSWEVVVFQDKTANAFALPGGRIGVNTGLLPVARSQDQLATVLGHEVAHVIARHGAERVSQSEASNLLQAGVAASGIVDPATSTGKLALGALGLGVEYGVLMPYSRTQESEADLLGLDYMARAGFDPSQSVALWKNMAASGGQAPPEFLSTHPSHETRIQDLEKRIPAAKELMQQARAAGRRPSCKP